MKELTRDEVKKIYLILKALKMDYYDEKLIDKKGIDTILSKLALLLTKYEIRDIDKKVLRRKYSTFSCEVDEKVYSTIEKTFDNKNTLEISYFSLGKGESIKRKIDIYYKSRKYIIAFCHLRNAIRKFRTGRIVSAKLTNKKYTVPEDFNKKEFL